MADPYPIRPVGPEELSAYHAVDEQAFFGQPLDERHRADLTSRLDFDRTLTAFDGGTPVGTAGAWSLRLCLPGAMAPAAGVTLVAVLPTYRRRGILTSLMRRQLADIRARGEAIAVLWASEAGIYGRYGYGTASWQANFWFGRGDGALGRHAPAAEPGLRLRLAEPAAARAELAKIHQTVLPDRPGMFARDEAWWDRVLRTADDGEDEGNPLRCVLAEDDTGPRGYAIYTASQRWDGKTFLADSALSVRELIAADPAAAAALWRDLLSRDLVTEFTATLRPVDDPLLHMLADPRRAHRRIGDGLWVRVIDVAKALSQRRYACPVDVVIDVTDELLPQNAGRWRLATSGPPGSDGAPGFGATCGPAGGPGSTGSAGSSGSSGSAAADLALDIRSLGAAYLGGTRLGELARAGQVTEHRPGAVAALSAAMSWDPAPWCPVIF